MIGGLEAGEDLDAAGGAYALVARDAVEGATSASKRPLAQASATALVVKATARVSIRSRVSDHGGDQLGADALRDESSG